MRRSTSKQGGNPKGLRPGDRVRILTDIREGEPATGLIAEYEGEFPIEAIVVMPDGQFSECDYEPFLKWNEQQERPLPHFMDVTDELEAYEKEHPRPQHPDGHDLPDEAFEEYAQKCIAWRRDRGIPHYLPINNPRFILPDGSKIWGAECWWAPADIPEDDALEDLEKTQAIIRAVLGGG